MKIYLNNPKESWVVDRFRSEWYQDNKDISTKSILMADIIWLIAPWTWKKISLKNLSKKKVVCTIHHIDFDKFDSKEEKTFYERDKYVDIYHAISPKTAEQIKKLTNKTIFTLPFWVNQNLWFEIKDKKKIRNKYNFKENDYLIGSFQRDTEGHDLSSPKLSKGPDLFVSAVLKLYEKNQNIKVVLSGKRRQYIMNELKSNNIPFNYFDMIDFVSLNELYNCLDLYIVSSRVEGGPQAILECGINKTPIISTDVGVASIILSPESIVKSNNFDRAIPNTHISNENSLKYTIPDWYKSYREIFSNLL
mgnify:CR=1 FL=1|tara:strand:+ start:12918 stop:13835 length:918 start_codon:yes stop_codon:yes gene_type:complete